MANDEYGERDERSELRVQDLCTKESWWNVPHLVKLNFMLAVPFMSAYIGGYDGSVLNGMQTLEHWKTSMFFRRPQFSVGAFQHWQDNSQRAETNSRCLF